jgi:DNA segregation ATPase FtsK/SpoIIIE, S-DNA-T family
MPRRKKTPKVPVLSMRPELSAEAGREIVAILLVAVALLLILAMFNIGGTFATVFFGAVRLGLGLVAYIVPVIILILAWMLFQPAKYELKANNYLGLIGFVLALTGLLHVIIPRPDAMTIAQQGSGGGYAGYGISLVLLTIMNVPAAFTVLVALWLICLVMAADARLTDIWNMILAVFRGQGGDELQINEPAGLVINTKLPIKGKLSVGDSKRGAKEEPGALTVSGDADWQPPDVDLLEQTSSKADAGNVKENAAVIQHTLESFGIEVAMGEVNVGPTVTQYTLKPSSGVKLNKITGLDTNLALSLAAHPIRVEAPIPGKSAVGVEVPNKTPAMVRMRDLITSEEVATQNSPLTFVLGRDVAGIPAVADLARMPHMLIAGATGSGKSVMINGFLMSLLYRNSPSDLKLILVDPKRVELSLYNDIPHLLAPVIVEPEKCISALKWAVAEMERRYKLFAEVGKRNIFEYNQAVGKEKSEEGAHEAMPFILVVIDELADLMALAAADVEALIVRLAQMARATGIHLVLATQRPSVDVITGLIKANIPARVAFSVASYVDSRTILDQSGAEKLLGKGDMLFLSPEFIKPRRVQGAFVSEKEVRAVTDYLRSARKPQYNDEVLTQQVKLGGGRAGGGMDDLGEPDDALFNEAAETVIRSGKASASLLQRRLRVGYARAARLLDLLEERGVVGPADGARPRDVLVNSLNDVMPSDDASGYGE